MTILIMKKVLGCLSVIILVLLFVIIVGAIVVKESIVHIQLPHGARLHILPAPKNNQVRGAVIICPGGGYGYLSKWKEGYWWFPFFYRQGYAVAVLEYRMPKGDHQIPKTDASEAIKMMRLHAAEWHFDKDNVGFMGFSAGGHLASTMMVTAIDSVRPSFGILFYPVISMKKELTHKGSHDRLLGENASEQLEAQFSNELHVTEKTPPTYIAVSDDDSCVNPLNSKRFYDVMRDKGRPVTLHVYPSGDHGWGYNLSFEHHSQMLDDLAEWLKKRATIKR